MSLAVLILLVGSITSLILFLMIYLGARNNQKMKALNKNMNLSTSETKENLLKVLESLEENKNQQDRIIDRLQNLETIVTSEAWEAIKEGRDSEHINLLLDDVEDDEISFEEKAEHIAKRIKH